jgi:adenosylcobinamide amidohydrolase
MPQTVLTTGVALDHAPDHIHVELDITSPIVSSAVLNGGFVKANHILNLNVKNPAFDGVDIGHCPDIILAEFCRNHGWPGKTVGMMTAADMDSFRMVRATEQGVDIFVLATTGFSNARRAGDCAEHRKIGSPQLDAGTINIICLTTASMAPAAMVEAVITTTEAKTAALQNLGIISPVSNGLATGTGTDAIAIASGHGSIKINYCGKHVIFGEILANLVIEAVYASIKDR